MSKVSTVVVIKPGMIGPIMERYALEMWDLSLANTGNSVANVHKPLEFMQSKCIASMFSYPESRERWCSTSNYLYMNLYVMYGQWYLYDCGDGNYLGADEPASRGEKEFRAFDWGRAYQRIYDALIDYPGIKPVVTHPKPPLPINIGNDIYRGMVRPFTDFGTDIVYAFDAHAIAMGVCFNHVPEGAEVWAYYALYEADTQYEDPFRANWMSVEPPTPYTRPWDIQPWCRDCGVSAVLINSLRAVPYLFNVLTVPLTPTYKWLQWQAEKEFLV